MLINDGDGVKIYAPFTCEQVAALNTFQNTDHIGHPFTCPNRGDGHHKNDGRDLGLLTATGRGWVCYSCDYMQGWAWASMASPERHQKLIEALARAHH